MDVDATLFFESKYITHTNYPTILFLLSYAMFSTPCTPHKQASLKRITHKKYLLERLMHVSVTTQHAAIKKCLSLQGAVPSPACNYTSLESVIQLKARAGHHVRLHGSPGELGETEGGRVDGSVVVPEGLQARSFGSHGRRPVRLSKVHRLSLLVGLATQHEPDLPAECRGARRGTDEDKAVHTKT